MRAIILRCLVIGSAALCGACGTPVATYEVVKGVDPVLFKRDYASCTTEWGSYIFTYKENPLEPTSLFEKCMQAHGYDMRLVGEPPP